MKNLIKSILTLIIVSGMLACSSLENQGRSSYDDVYFIPGSSNEITDHQNAFNVEEEKNTVSRPEPVITNPGSKNAYQENQSKEYQEYYDESGGNQNNYNQNTINNYYYSDPYHDFRYSKRINRFHRPYSSFGYYHTIYSWPYYTPYYTPYYHNRGWSVSVRYSSRPFYHHYPYYYPYHYSYYNPYYGFYYDPFYYGPHYNYSLGYHHGYHTGYHTGLWTTSSIGSGTTVKPVKNVYSGPRSSTGGSNIGGNISSSSSDGIRSSRFEAPPLDDDKNNTKVSDKNAENSSSADQRLNPHERRDAYPQSDRTRDSYSIGRSENSIQTTPSGSGSRDASGTSPRHQNIENSRSEPGNIDNNRTSSPTYRRNDVFSSPQQDNSRTNRQVETGPRSQPSQSSSPGNNNISPRDNNNSSPSGTSPRRSGGRR